MHFLKTSNVTEIEQALDKKLQDIGVNDLYDHLQHGWHSLMDWCGKIFTDPKGKALALQWGAVAGKWDKGTLRDPQTLVDQLEVLKKARERAVELKCHPKALLDKSNTYKKTYTFEEAPVFQNAKLPEQKLPEVAKLLQTAADHLDAAGLIREANVVTTLLIRVADAATQGLTPERMLANLAEKGWVFNTDDSEIKELDAYITHKGGNCGKSPDCGDSVPTNEEEAPETMVVEEPEQMDKTAMWWTL